VTSSFNTGAVVFASTNHYLSRSIIYRLAGFVCHCLTSQNGLNTKTAPSLYTSDTSGLLITSRSMSLRIDGNTYVVIVHAYEVQVYNMVRGVL